MNIQTTRRGFTLIELLVVLTIIGLLAALLFPVFLRVRENARQTACISNLHQIGLALQTYQSDNNGLLPARFGDASEVAANEQPKLDMLLPYEHSPAIYHCPDAPYHVDGTSGPLGTVYLDYNSRIADFLDSNEGLFPSGVPSALMKPEAMSVLVYDAQHCNNGNLYLILRENGSVSRVPEARTQEWQYYDGNWQLLSPKSADQRQPWIAFPDEPWPPQFEK